MISQQLEKSLEELKSITCTNQNSDAYNYPKISKFLITHTLNILEAEREKIEEITGVMKTSETEKILSYLNQQIKTIREMITN